MTGAAGLRQDRDMGTVYLHIGLPKTGTSTVQGAIQQLRPLLETRGYWTPLRIMAHHRFAAEALAPGDPRLQMANFQRVLASGNDGVFAEFKDAVRAGKNILLSTEYLNTCGGPATLRLLSRFGIEAADVRIIVCLRRQDRFIESSYNQAVKRMGNTLRLAWSREKAAPWDWNRKLGEWADVFGEDALRVLVYERIVKQARGALFVKPVLAACGLDLQDADFERISTAVADYSNASLPAELVEFKRTANLATRIGELDWLMEKAMAAGLGGTPFRMDAALAREIVEFYKASNAEVARRFLGEEGPLFDDVVEERVSVPPADFDARLMSQLLALLAAEIGALRVQSRAALQRRKSQGQASQSK